MAQNDIIWVMNEATIDFNELETGPKVEQGFLDLLTFAVVESASIRQPNPEVQLISPIIASGEIEQLAGKWSYVMRVLHDAGVWCRYDVLR